jgi:hypothetical protein
MPAVLLAWLLVIRPPWDPDLGWHLRNGGDVLRFGAPKGDLYSHTMFGYPWVSHEWLTDVLMYLINHYWGLVALSVVFGAITVGAYIVAARVARTRWESVGVSVIVAALVALPVVGIRPQMLTLLGLAITLWLLFRWRDDPKTNLVYWLPLVLLVWVNMHGSFAIGLFLMFVFGVIELIKYLLRQWGRVKLAGHGLTLPQLIQLVGVGVVSFGMTFVNPYTWRVYDELFRTIFNSTVRQGISEWLPVSFSQSSSYNLVIYAALLGLLLVFSIKKVDSTKLWLGGVFLILSLSSWRNMPWFPLVTLPLLAEMVEMLAPKGLAYHLKSGWVILALLGLVGFVGYDRYHTVIPLSVSDELMGTVQSYPYGALQYLKQNQPSGKLFNEYNWGGYLVWKLPEKRVFIDGRMAVWQTKTQDIFKDYLAISHNDPNASQLLDAYDVDVTLTYTDRPLSRYLIDHADAWQLVYRDTLASVFLRVKTGPIAD